MRTLVRILRYSALAVAALGLLLLFSFAIPLSSWRTGEVPVAPLPLVEGGPAVEMPRRVWIDTDAACGHAPRADADDCFALLLLARAPGIEIVGISTTYGNASRDVALRTVADLSAALARDGVRSPPIHRGSAAPTDEFGRIAVQPAHAALRRALAGGPLTLVSLGPLTNIAAALRDRPDLQANVARLVALMGRRPGHLFHPAEGRGSGGILFGHGPVFRDFNFAQDPAAAAAVLDMGLPTTLVPYEAARQVSLTGADLARMTASDGAAAWVAGRARGWLDFWRDAIGLPGFYPFDALAAAYVVAPRLLDCAEAVAWIAPDEKSWHRMALLVGPDHPDRALASAPTYYCPRVDPLTHGWLVRRLADGHEDAGDPSTAGPDRSGSS